MRAAYFLGGFIAGAVSMWAVILWILSDTEEGMT